MSRIVRSSKYRHVFGTVFKKEDCYDDLRATRNAWDSNFVTASPKFWAVIFEAGGGGAFAVHPWVSTGGKVDPKLPVVAGHKGAVLDIDFSPFNDNLIASASEDCTAKVWSIPDGGLKQNMTDPVQTLNGHKRKVGTVLFHPTANNILASSSGDFSVKIWDVEKGTAPLSVDGQHADLIQSVAWNDSGSLLVTSCKDKKLRIIDPRSNTVSGETESHQGVKGTRAIWLGRKETIFSAGFTKTSEREFAIYDPRNFGTPLTRQNVDSSSGILMPFFDRDTNILFLAGKGDGNIRYYEMVDEAPYIHYLSEFKSSTPQRGMCLMPKRAVNVSECEIVRILKLSTKLLEPISFQVPRKSDIFQDDIFPPCFSGEPTLSADQWLGGQNGEPKTQSMQGGFVAKPQQEVKFDKQEEASTKVLSEKELRDEVDKLTKRVAYLEAELVKKDAKIKELSS